MARPVKPGRACPRCRGDLDAGCHASGCQSASQLALAGALRYLDAQPRRGVGRPGKNSPPVGYSRDEIAVQHGVSRSQLDEAIRVVEVLRARGDLETISALQRGSKPVGEVYDKIVRAEQRERLLTSIPDWQAAKFQVILADPPWQYDDDGVGRRGAAESHYPTMPLGDLMKMRTMIDEISADDAMLVMWATSPLLAEAIALMDAWGFGKPISTAVWHKTGRIGMGSIFRIDHEFLLVGRRGAGFSRDDNRVRSLLAAPVTAHSAKPDVSYEAIERLWPAATKIELFARRRRAGWESWGG